MDIRPEPGNFVSDAETELSGVIERITFHNLDNGYCVLRVQARGHRELVTVVGTHAAGRRRRVHVGDRRLGHRPDTRLAVQGRRDQDNPPHTAEGIAKYLGSGLVKGIGPKYAERIVDVFGENTLDVIDKSPTFLAQVKGIGPKLIEKIRESWHEQKAVRSIMVFLHSYGIGTARAVRIYKTYGEQRDRDGEGEPVPPQHRHLGRRVRNGRRAGAEARHPARLAVPRPGRGAARPLGSGIATATSAIPEELLRERAAAMTRFRPRGSATRSSSCGSRTRWCATSIAVRNAECGTAGMRTRKMRPAQVRFRVAAFRIAALLFLKPLFLAELGVARAVQALAQGRTRSRR